MAATAGPAAAPGISLAVRDLGLVAYDDALAIQQQVADALHAGTGPDTLLLLEHPHVVTLGRNARAAHVLLPEAELERRGVTLRSCGRGGDVTYHGPGQLVGWPVVRIPEGRRDVHRYVRDLEEGLIRALATFGIAGERSPGFTGVWVGRGPAGENPPEKREKVAAIGVRISRWVTTHGFALNVSTDLSYFRLITPCGISDRGVTSMEKLLGAAPAMSEVKAGIAAHLGDVFGAP